MHTGEFSDYTYTNDSNPAVVQQRKDSEMKKAIKHTDLYIGQLVVVTEHPETRVYTIAATDGHVAILQWQEGTRHCSQKLRIPTNEKYGLFKPTLAQIEYSIAANGPLVSTKELVEWA